MRWWSSIVGGPAHVSLALILLASLLFGVLDAPRLSASQALVLDLVGSASAANGIAFANLAAHLVGVVAGVAAGFVLAAFGLSAALATVAGAHLAAAALLLGKRWAPANRRSFRRGAPSADPLAPLGVEISRMEDRPEGSDPTRSTWTGLRTDTGAVLRVRLVRVIAAAAVTTKIFAFSSVALLPSFALSVFRIGPDGLGNLYAVRSLGAVLGLLSLARAKDRYGGGPLLLILAGLFGLGLLGFSLAPSVGLAFVALAVIGPAGAAVDASNQTLLHQSVPEPNREQQWGCG